MKFKQFFESKTKVLPKTGDIVIKNINDDTTITGSVLTVGDRITTVVFKTGKQTFYNHELLYKLTDKNGVSQFYLEVD